MHMNEEASVILIKNKEQLWMWTRAKEQQYPIKAISNDGFLMRQIRKNAGMFRSSSSDRVT